jgi:hypothetical protein
LRLWQSPDSGEPIEFQRHPLARDREIDDLENTLARKVVYDVQDSQAPTICKLIGDEIGRPAFIRPLRHSHRHPWADELLATLGAYLEDNGPEFTGKAMFFWSQRTRVLLG